MRSFSFPGARRTGPNTASIAAGSAAAKMNVVHAELGRILHDLDPRAPGILDERELEESGRVPDRRRDLYTGRLQCLHRRVEFGTEKPM